MDVPHQLQTFLQFLVTDTSAVTHLTYILDHLSSTCLAPSPHLQKWITRVTSLMRSKGPAARWAAMCIAYRMSSLSESLLIENAQSWIGNMFPSLLKSEPIPILKASMRYLSLVLSAARHNPEFQRQVAIPNIPKVSSAILTIAEKHNDRDIKTLSIQILSRLVPLYPSLHKALSQRLSALCHHIFGGSMHCVTDNLLDATANLYAVLHFLGGKIGGTNLWRNCLDEVLRFSWSAWLALRTTFPTSVQLSHKAMAHIRPSDGDLLNPPSLPGTMTGNPLTTVTLNLHRLKCGISAISALLRVPVNRPVRVPVGHLATFCWCLLTSACDDEGQAHYYDPHARTTESAVVPQIWIQACRLLSFLAQTTQQVLVPHVSKLITVISSHLENETEPSHKFSLLRCAYHLLYFCPAVDAALAIDRLLKATIFVLSPLYLPPSRTESNSEATDQRRPNKKRRRDYEVENALTVTNITVCGTLDECEMLIAALDVVAQCMLNTELAQSLRSLASRVLLSILLSLPSIQPSSLSCDPSFHGRVIRKVRDICMDSRQGTSHIMSKITGLVLRSFSTESLETRDKLHSQVDLLLHPRRPPFVRTLPFVEALSLSSAEESVEETETRQTLVRLIASEPQMQAETEPVIQDFLALDQRIPPKSSQEQVSSTPMELHPQTIMDANGHLSVEALAPPVALVVSPSQILSDAPARSPLAALISQRRPVPSEYTAPMLVDGSDHEEVPTIDLGSDSDT